MRQAIDAHTALGTKFCAVSACRREIDPERLFCDSCAEALRKGRRPSLPVAGLTAALLDRSRGRARADTRLYASVRTDPTPAELEVLKLIAEGLTNAEIGEALGRSRLTVASHKKKLFRAIQARTSAHAVAIGFRRGILA